MFVSLVPDQSVLSADGSTEWVASKNTIHFAGNNCLLRFAPLNRVMFGFQPCEGEHFGFLHFGLRSNTRNTNESPIGKPFCRPRICWRRCFRFSFQFDVVTMSCFDWGCPNFLLKKKITQNTAGDHPAVSLKTSNPVCISGLKQKKLFHTFKCWICWNVSVVPDVNTSEVNCHRFVLGKYVRL